MVDENKEFKIEAKRFVSKGKNTPLEGWVLKGMPVITICKGKINNVSEKLLSYYKSE